MVDKTCKILYLHPVQKSIFKFVKIPLQHIFVSPTLIQDFHIFNCFEFVFSNKRNEMTIEHYTYKHLLCFRQTTFLEIYVFQIGLNHLYLMRSGFVKIEPYKICQFIQKPNFILCLHLESICISTHVKMTHLSQQQFLNAMMPTQGRKTLWNLIILFQANFMAS